VLVVLYVVVVLRRRLVVLVELDVVGTGAETTSSGYVHVCVALSSYRMFEKSKV
jgi:hypothetical protein